MHFSGNRGSPIRDFFRAEEEGIRKKLFCHFFWGGRGRALITLFCPLLPVFFVVTWVQYVV